MQLSGKTAVVTGGSSGIGLATACLFVEHGARVAITGRDPKTLANAASRLGDRGFAVEADVRSLEQLRAAATTVASMFGTVDVLFANAGVAYSTPIDATDEARYEEIMAINIKGVFFTVQAFLPLMRPGSSIVLNTSWLADTGTPGLSLLSASKAAVRSLSRTLAAELLPRSIRVNAVSPGAMLTPIHAKTGLTTEQQAAFAERMRERIPLGRFGEAADVAAATLFLASDASSYMLGAEIAIDGGFAQL